MATQNAIEVSGRSVDDAVQTALRRLGLSRAQVEVDVLEEGRTGIFGIGHAQSRVRVTPLGGRAAADTTAPALPRIDDYDDLTEVERGAQDSRSSQGGRRGGRRGSRRSTASSSSSPQHSQPARDGGPDEADSQREVQPDHRSRSRSRIQDAPPSGSGRRGRRGGGGGGGGRGRAGARRSGESRERQPARAPIPPFELLADPEFEPNEDPRQFAVELLTDLVHLIGFDVQVTARDPQTPMDGLGHAQAVLEVTPIGDEDLGLLIGRHGANVGYLQYLVNVIVSRSLDGNHPVTVDVDGYRHRREEALVAMAQRAADEVREHGEPVSLGAMPAAERRIIHLQLQDDDELTTESSGEGESRRVRILYRDT